jgi:hypothetical protein
MLDNNKNSNLSKHLSEKENKNMVHDIQEVKQKTSKAISNILQDCLDNYLPKEKLK